MLPRRTPAADPETAARVRALLRADGWLPPSGLPDGRGPHTGGAAPAATADRAGGNTGDDDAGLGRTGDDDDDDTGLGRTGERYVGEPGRPGAQPSDAPEQRSPEPPARAGSRPEPAGPPAAGLLDRWRGSRIDPGVRGVAALALVAVLAAGLAALVLLRGRPTSVSAPTVVSSGVPVPGSSPATTSSSRVATGTGPTASGPSATPVGSAAAPAPGAGQVVVSVVGKVAVPGLVRLPMGSRVDDAVRAAGGLLPGTDPAVLNGARRLVDGEQVLVGVPLPAGAQPGYVAGPDAGTGASSSGTGTDTGGPGGSGTGGPGGSGTGGGDGGAVVDLNTATAGQLDALPGIGPVLAQRIVDWRTQHGRFGSVDQLREVDGIGESKYAELQSKVRV